MAAAPDLTPRPFISIIIPLFNAEPFFEQALADIKAQSYQDWELIFVDDGSTDETLELVQQAALHDRRIRFFSHGKDLGVSAARNTGIKHARGNYIWFADPDDRYKSKLLERALSAAQSIDNGADIVTFGLVEEYRDAQGSLTQQQKIRGLNQICHTPQEFYPLVLELEKKTLYGYVWNKLFKRTLIQDLRFDTGLSMHEDFYFCADAFEKAQNCVCIPDSLYRYQRYLKSHSLTSTFQKENPNEFYQLHANRILKLIEQQKQWKIFDQKSRSILGGLATRYIASALAKTYEPHNHWNKKRRLSFMRSIQESLLYTELIAYARAESLVLSCTIFILRRRSLLLWRMLGWSASHLRRFGRGLFIRIKTKR